MAERRMFAKTIIDSDMFLDMPLSTQALYFHLSMRADDDGFINNPRKIQRMIGAADDDLKVLVMKRFILPFDSGVVVIKHWKIHNYIRNDRYKETVYLEEKAQLELKENGVYTELDTTGIPDGIPTGNQMETQYRLEENSEVEISTVKNNKHKYGEYKNVLLTDEEVEKLKAKFPDWENRIETLSQGIEMKGYKYKSHYLAILKWAERDTPQPQNREYTEFWE